MKVYGALVVAALFLGLAAGAEVAETPAEKVNQDKGKAYRDTFIGKPGVTILPSGVIIEMIEPGAPPKDGSAPIKIDPDTDVEYTYLGTTTDGVVFDDSSKHAKKTIFAPNEVLPGLGEALQLLHKDDKVNIIIPSDMAFGHTKDIPNIPPGSTIVFKDLVVVDVVPDGAPSQNRTFRRRREL